MFDEKIVKLITIILIVLGILIVGVQIGIHHGRELQQQEYYDYICAN